MKLGDYLDCVFNYHKTTIEISFKFVASQALLSEVPTTGCGPSALRCLFGISMEDGYPPASQWQEIAMFSSSQNCLDFT